MKRLLCNTVSSGQNPLGANQGSSAQILVQRIDQSHLVFKKKSYK